MCAEKLDRINFSLQMAVRENAKFLLHNEGKVYVGALSCRTDEIVQTGIHLSGKLYIKVGYDGYAACGCLYLKGWRRGFASRGGRDEADEPDGLTAGFERPSISIGRHVLRS